MRVASLVLSILALLAVAAGIFAYWIGSALICVDVCPPVSSASQQLPVIVVFTLGPGVLLSLAATVVTLLNVRRAGRTVMTAALIVTPITAVIVAALVLLVAGGSLTPVASPGPSDVAPADRQVASDWLNVTRYVVLPLLAWPASALVGAALPRKVA